MMPARPFSDQSTKPTGQSLQATLGNTYSFYEKILALPHRDPSTHFVATH